MTTTNPAAPSVPSSIERDPPLRMYRMMQECRLFEVRAEELLFEGLVLGTTHLGVGQEAVAACVAEDLSIPTIERIVDAIKRRLDDA